jgi:nucleoside-diphosphate-sugar epimerase
MTRVLVTGAAGFVGRQLCEVLSGRGYTVRAALRTDISAPPQAAEQVVVGDINRRTDWDAALHQVQLVVHCAARAHVMGDVSGESDRYMETNAYGTEQLARASLAAGVRRFVYLSSVKVNGERTSGRPFSCDDEPRPTDPYGVSKWAGESRLAAIAAASSMQTAVVRSPLVYGPRVRANFLRLMALVERRIPLPLASVTNTRSLVSVWNLCDLIERLLRDAILPNAVFMVSDGEDLSTPELLRRMGTALGRPARLLPVPVTALRVAAAIAGRRNEFERLCETLTVDISRTRSELKWTPPVSVDDGLARTARWYISKDDAP